MLLKLFFDLALPEEKGGKEESPARGAFAENSFYIFSAVRYNDFESKFLHI